MERIELYDIDLKNLRETSAVYSYSVGDEFFKLIEATGIEKGDLEVSVTVKKGIGAFKLNFHIQGFVIGICDRCLDEVEVDARGGAQARDVAGIGRDLRLEQDDLHRMASLVDDDGN